MTDHDLRTLQAPLKDRYRTDPATALATLRVRGDLDREHLACRITTGRGAVIVAGMHPLAGGDGSFACSAEMLLEALVGCAGTTVCAVATAMNIPFQSGSVEAEGDLDFRGTMGVSREVPVGFLAIRLVIRLATTASDDQLNRLGQIVERYCVVAQSLNDASRPTVRCERAT
jgi:uncharacterized OsmC-like protein